ncbi:AaceriACL141Cp [[Ashbya] aceris (nom. inval.)]|nr:AaceriACL141Cp [[Ashbya] aceris (nom. inval.)]
MSIPKERLQQVAQISARIFDQCYNPSGARIGTKILTKRLRGPAMVQYYGNPDVLRFRQLKSLYPGFKFIDEEEQYRLQMVDSRKRRGKGAPTKKKEASTDTKKKRK